MKRRCAILAVAGALLGILPASVAAQGAPGASAAATPGASAASAPTETQRSKRLTAPQQASLCNQAKGLLDAGYGADAEALYRALIGRAPCATSGARRAAAQQAKATASEKRAAQLASSACTVGKAFENAGLKEDARTAYKKAVESNGATCAVAALKRLGKNLKDQSDELLKELNNALGVVAAGVGLALLLGYVLAIVLGRVWGIRSLWPLSRIRRPSLELNTIDDGAADKKVGQATATLVRGRISQPRHFPGSLSIVSGEGSVAASLTGLSDLNAQLKAVVTAITVLDRALPRRRFLLEGVLQPQQSDLGVGISVALKYNGSASGGFTHWATRYAMPATIGEVDGYRRLTAPAAAWAEHMIALQLKARRLVTHDSLSYALLQAGLERLAEQNRKDAKTLYQAALERHPANIGAMVSLGLLEAQDNNDELAEELFEGAQAWLEENSDL
jgi:hypothetical protein